MPHRKHIAIRTCSACGKKADKRELVRLVRTDDGIIVDLSGKMKGRGTYVCPGMECQEASDMNDVFRKISRALRVDLNDTDRLTIRQLVSS